VGATEELSLRVSVAALVSVLFDDPEDGRTMLDDRSVLCAGAAVTRSLGKELGSRKIRLNSINSGMVEAEGTYSAGIIESDFRKQTEATTPLGRIAQPQDIAPAVVFLASSDSSFIIGETLYISGGLR
jgi:NAD(P)-dependent dehydrogenase (short-subunit alcohol dehydrogenase family)